MTTERTNEHIGILKITRSLWTYSNQYECDCVQGRQRLNFRHSILCSFKLQNVAVVVVVVSDPTRQFEKDVLFVYLSVSLWDSDVGELSPGVFDVTLDVLADDGLLVVAGNVVPFDSVLEKGWIVLHHIDEMG